MSKHTKGPWTYIEIHTERNIYGPNKELLAEIFCPLDYGCEGIECQANANLIAAAPEMYEVLEEIVKLDGVGNDQITNLMDMQNLEAEYVLCVTKAKSILAKIKESGE